VIEPSEASAARPPGDDPAVPDHDHPSMPPLLRLLRPRQWVKNVLVFAGPAAAGVLDQADEAARASLVFVAFCLAASGTYCLNDANDVAVDRAHPRKRERPVASGAVSIATARLVGVALLAAALVVASLTGEWEAPAIVGTYMALTTTYTYWLKHVAVVDIVAVALGFVIRSVAGIVGTEIPVSDWYLIVASFGSLFLVAGKRSAELNHASTVGAQRPALEQYSREFLQYVRAVSSGVVLLAYCLWAFEKADLASSSFPWFQLSIVPFACVILRYALVQATDEHEAPEDIVLGDRQLQLMGLVWAVVMACGVYLTDAPPLTS
jgi:decaprenyl-phosphate phosphoribosyltransferase